MNIYRRVRLFVLGLFPENKQALADIRKFGCHIINVLEDNEGPGFGYSIGIYERTGSPELVVTGLDSKLAASIINNYNSRIRSGETFEPEHKYADFLEGFDVMFRPVAKDHFYDYFGWCRWYYSGNNFKVYQLIWPSTSGSWPWDETATDEYKYFVPHLGG